MMDLSIVLLEIAQMRQQELWRQVEAERRWKELEELRSSLPQRPFNHLRVTLRELNDQIRHHPVPAGSDRMFS